MLALAESTFLGFQDGVTRTPTDTLGRSWGNVVLDTYQPKGRIRQTPSGLLSATIRRGSFTTVTLETLLMSYPTQDSGPMTPNSSNSATSRWSIRPPCWRKEPGYQPRQPFNAGANIARYGIQGDSLLAFARTAASDGTTLPGRPTPPFRPA